MHFCYPNFHISTVLFQYYEQHQYLIHGQILKPITCVEPSTDLSGNAMPMISSVLKNSGANLSLNGDCHMSPILHILNIWQFVRTQLLYTTRVILIYGIMPTTRED
jgi:hypothetical protein